MIPIIRIACVALLLLDLAAAAAPGRRETPPGPIAMEGELPARSAISGLFDQLDFQHASQINTHAVTSSQFFGTREELKNNYLYRFLRRDADGGITLHVQSDSPGKDGEANWLPAPNGPFYTVLRSYQPKVAVQTGKWMAPRLVPESSSGRSHRA